jgi:hypothetical protein
VVLYKGKCIKEDFEDAFNAGSTFNMTPKGYITTEGFCKFFIISIIIDYLEEPF